MDPSRRTPLPDPAAVVASLLAMMTRFSLLGCPRLAGRIRRNLALLQHYADDEMPPLLKQLAVRLEREWAELQQAISDTDDAADHSEPRDLHAALPASQSLH